MRTIIFVFFLCFFHVFSWAQVDFSKWDSDMIDGPIDYLKSHYDSLNEIEYYMWNESYLKNKKTVSEEMGFILNQAEYMTNLSYIEIENVNLKHSISSVQLPEGIKTILLINTKIVSLFSDTVKSLEKLHLTDNRIKTITPSCFPYLKELSIAGNPCQKNLGTIDSLKKLPMLKTLIIGGRHFCFPEQIGEIESLDTLWFTDNKRLNLYEVLTRLNRMHTIKPVYFWRCHFLKYKFKQITFKKGVTYHFFSCKLPPKQRDFISARADL